MEPGVSLVTLGVSDLERSVAFYRDAPGWPRSDVGGDEVAWNPSFPMGADGSIELPDQAPRRGDANLREDPSSPTLSE